MQGCLAFATPLPLHSISSNRRFPPPQEANFAISELLGGETKTVAYLQRVQLLASQLQRWSAAVPKAKPSFFRQLLELGAFVDLPSILAKTLPFVAAATAEFDGGVEAAIRVSGDAALLAIVAGDG